MDNPVYALGHADEELARLIVQSHFVEPITRRFFQEAGVRAGMRVLDRGMPAVRVGGDLGVAGTKGFVGGFLESHLPDFGEPLLREVYAETGREVDALARGLEAIAETAHRVVLLHYAPTSSTLVGEREAIWTLLGSERLAGPIVRHNPDLVLHGHAHAGSPAGHVGAVPVFNVAWPLIGGAFHVFDLASAA